ncbi:MULTISPECIES: L-aspartate oxidase [Enterobacteriaceae]|jgi:L-aspartate oxidase|uniref:L-aspartate oxidase n=2 Tax=Enterobacteriaceae TaxID=543 RepID=A0ABW1Q0U9_9ENTR|nr:MULTISPECIES: L-aspartate oxidase [Enterobacteriaceae]AUU92420.1 L-aspartate oxidase [Enterobacteriaceae bacterium ENNIH3]AUV07538.1 L-aspartate oxidase [Enterobacteriaceae bacterium ENNIH2]MBS6737482.1 L-aspartate oxidase [Enterobacteriaceae bacterium]PTA90985.1 L-aspartate oxidase [Kluyvera sp. Nf5]PWF54115.1 L-aspartate oxidase [[Kluyvera] intestini]PXW49970.1 L-aspartate oxidase [Grimontella sp. AG753]QIH62266.1 L-aspartate oxidase [Enterobacteriaceae bacterium A-F18]SLJ87305.1 L-asp
MKTTPELSCDVLVIGSGAAGLSVALRLAERHNVIVLSKGPVSEGSTFYAQGGIAAVFDETDSVESHVEDTLIAGAGIVERQAAEFVASNARQCVQWLIDQGVAFDMQVDAQGSESYHLTREGGHSHRRILHAADATGKEVENTLVSKALNHPNIHIIERSNAVDLIVSDKIGLPGTRRVVGAWIWNRNKEIVETCHAKAVVLATGGASKVYQYTTNPDISSGDGIAMAWRAGCRVANLEFNQFHPTALFHPQARNFLLTEALRGEGAHLKRPDGTRFMPDFDPRGELAPRDVVARAIDHEMKRLGVDCMYLDISHKPEDFVRQHFPMIYEKLLGLGIDLTKDQVPIVPAAHYTCGGVMVDEHGRADVDGLYAIGEVSYTGLHGANRMASNSLLECLVYGWSAAEDIDRRIGMTRPAPTLPAWDESRVDDADERVILQHNWHELRLFMWDYVGIVRTTKRLERALRRITLLQQEIDEYYANFRVSNNLLELRNLVQVAELIVRCAMERKESRGLHYTLDYPDQLPESGPTVLSPRTYMNK